MTKLSMRVDGDRDVVVTRAFAAPPQLVYRAHTEPELIRKWMYGYDGWILSHCTYEARPGGKIRLDWEDPSGQFKDTNGKNGFYLTGEFIAVTPGERTEHIERMHMPEPLPDNHCVTTFAPKGAGTLLTLRMTLPDAESRATMLETGMEDGMELSYARIDPMLATMETENVK